MTKKTLVSKELPVIETIRKNIILIVLVIISFLGYPLFALTTTIHRAHLPIDEVELLAQNFLQQLDFKIPVYLDIPNNLEHFVPTAQKFIDSELSQELKTFWSIDLIKAANKVIDAENDYVVRFEYKEDEIESFYISPFSKEIKLVLSKNVINQVDEYLKKVLLDEVFRDEILEMSKLAKNEVVQKDSDLIFPYSSHYNIVFSLFVEDGKSIEWEIAKSVELFNGIFEKINHFANFTVSTQIQYYSKLSSEIEYDETSKAYIIDKSDLSTFINFGDWNLVTHDMSPTINFLVYFPESNYETIPMKIRNSLTNSFLIPQWGGVYIFNKQLPLLNGHKWTISETELYPVMEVFSSQLFQLLGVPNYTKSTLIRIDKLSRLTIVQNIKQSLRNLLSLIKLAKSLNEITIPDSTKNYVHQTLKSIRESIKYTSKQSYSFSMEQSSRALEYSDKAFFEKQMVQQAYFPSEHKMAVFLPLLGPVGSIVGFGTLKLVQEYLKGRKQKRE